MRRHRAAKRRIDPDPRFRDLMVARFINLVLRRGKKSTAETIVYGAFEQLERETGKKALEVFRQAVSNVRPLLETKSRRVGGATYQVPLEVREERGNSLAMRWVIGYAKGRKGKPMRSKLAQELLDAYRKTGSAMKKREEVHKMAESNRAFSHYRW